MQLCIYAFHMEYENHNVEDKNLQRRRLISKQQQQPYCHHRSPFGQPACSISSAFIITSYQSLLTGEKVKVLTNLAKPAFLLWTDPEHETVVSHVDEVDRLQRTVFNSLARQDPFVDQLLAAKIGSKISKGSNVLPVDNVRSVMKRKHSKRCRTNL